MRERPEGQVPRGDTETAEADRSRAEAMIDAIVKMDRVFLDGCCWRCAEAPGMPDDIGLCLACLEELRVDGSEHICRTDSG